MPQSGRWFYFLQYATCILYCIHGYKSFSVWWNDSYKYSSCHWSTHSTRMWQSFFFSRLQLIWRQSLSSWLVTIPKLKIPVCSISIIHPRCIREVFSDVLSSSPISGYFCIISAPTVTPAWLWKSQATSVIATCYARASTKAKKKTNKARLRPFL